jgi:hypothetical protein
MEEKAVVSLPKAGVPRRVKPHCQASEALEVAFLALSS